MTRGRLLHNATPWAPDAERAATLPERLRGLLGRRSLGPRAALLIERCGAVHTLGMRFPLDLVFLDRHGRVTRTAANVRPGRLCVWGGPRAARVIESEARCLDLAAVRPGDLFTFETEQRNTP